MEKTKNEYDVNKIVRFLTKYKDNLPKLYRRNVKADKLFDLEVLPKEEIEALTEKTPYEVSSAKRAITNICLPMPTVEEARAAFGNDFNPDKTLNGAIALAAAGDLAGPAVALMRAVFACPAADARLREAMIVRTSVRLNCIYAVHASARIALNSGLSKTEVEALTADGPVTGIDPDIVLIARMADDIADRATLGEDLLEAAIERWGVDNTRKLILMLSWFNLVNRYESACRVPNDSDEKLALSSGPT